MKRIKIPEDKDAKVVELAEGEFVRVFPVLGMRTAKVQSARSGRLHVVLLVPTIDLVGHLVALPPMDGLRVLCAISNAASFHQAVWITRNVDGYWLRARPVDGRSVFEWAHD